MSIKGNLYEHKYTPLITGHDYRLAQRTAKAATEQPRKYAGIPFHYRGLITCGTCGCSITPERSKGYIYYHCTQYRGKHGAKYVREEELTKQLTDVLAQIRPSQEQYDEVLVVLKSSHKERTAYRERRISTLQAELTKLDTRASRLQDAYLDGDIDKELYKIKNDATREKRRELNSLLQSIDSSQQEYYENSVKVMELVRNAPKLFESSKPGEKRSLLNIVLQNLELHGDQLRWKYKKPFDSMASYKNDSSWLGKRDSNPRMPGPEPGALPLGDSPIFYVRFLLCDIAR